MILGLLGIYLIAPFVAEHVEPWLHSALGFIPVFGEPQPVGNSLFTASLVLTIMVVPIIAALTRDLFMTVPGELRDGAEALGATRWEMIRGVVLPSTSSGVIAACVLGFGRAIGEAIAVSQVVGDQPLTPTTGSGRGHASQPGSAAVGRRHQPTAHLLPVLSGRDPVRVRVDRQPVGAADLRRNRNARRRSEVEMSATRTPPTR